MVFGGMIQDGVLVSSFKEALVDLINNIAVQSTNKTVVNIIKVTQAQYDALTPEATTLYIIVG